jgi:hypothetical protein
VATPWVPGWPALGAPWINPSQPRVCSLVHTDTRTPGSAHADSRQIHLQTDPGCSKTQIWSFLNQQAVQA